MPPPQSARRCTPLETLSKVQSAAIFINGSSPLLTYATWKFAGIYFSLENKPQRSVNFKTLEKPIRTFALLDESIFKGVESLQSSQNIL